MSAPDKLYIDYNPFDGKWKVLNSKEFPFGSGETPVEAINSARVVTDAPIYANSDFKGLIDSVLDANVKDVEDLTENEEIFTKDELIEALADLGGFKISKVYGHQQLLGYTMELIE